MTQLHEIQVTQGDIDAQAAAITIGGIQTWSITPEGAARLKRYNELTRLHPAGWRPVPGDLSAYVPHYNIYSRHPADLLLALEWAEGWPEAVTKIRVTGYDADTGERATLTGERAEFIKNLKLELGLEPTFEDFLALCNEATVGWAVATENPNFVAALQARDLDAARRVLAEEF